MQKILLVLALVIYACIMTGHVHSQQVSLATFQEIAQVIIDRVTTQNVTTSVTLQSTSIQEIRIPAELEQQIREGKSVKSIVLTNEEQCVLGVVDQSCIMINVERNPDDKGITAIQKSTRDIGDSYIDEINEAFNTSAEFHSIFIHTDDQYNRELGTSGSISGKGTISAVYTMPMEDTDSMYQKMAAELIPKRIRDGGGFYDVARSLASEDNAKMTFSLIPSEAKSLLQLKLSVSYPDQGEILEIDPLKFLKTKDLKRSGYFSTGFYPLNSIIQVVILLPESTSVSNIRGDIVPTQMVKGEKVPTDITREGWIFDPSEGQKIQGKYIFGEKTSVSQERMLFSLGGQQHVPETGPNELVTVVIITAVAAAAAVFYLKGYKRQSQ